MTGGENDPPGLYYHVDEDARLRLVYNAGQWSGTCTWTRSERNTVFDDDGNAAGYRWENTSGSERITIAPLREPTDVRVGQEVHVDVFGPSCGHGDLGYGGNLTVQRQESHTAPRQADGSMTWYAEWQPEWPAHAYAYWDVDTGLVVAWRESGRNSYSDGWMVDTDAPLS